MRSPHQKKKITVEFLTLTISASSLISTTSTVVELTAGGCKGVLEGGSIIFSGFSTAILVNPEPTLSLSSSESPP